MLRVKHLRDRYTRKSQNQVSIHVPAALGGVGANYLQVNAYSVLPILAPF